MMWSQQDIDLLFSARAPQFAPRSVPLP
jgi:hypothetical protein